MTATCMNKFYQIMELPKKGGTAGCLSEIKKWHLQITREKHRILVKEAGLWYKKQIPLARAMGLKVKGGKTGDCDAWKKKIQESARDKGS